MSEDFTVRDRRLFDKDGRLNDQDPPEQATPEQATPERAMPERDQPERPAPERAGPGNAEKTGRGRPEAPMPPPTFSGLLAGLAASAMAHLGEIQEQEAAEIDLPAAKQAIDLLGVLKAKTRGNLESEEEALLEALLYDLRLKYVKAGR